MPCILSVYGYAEKPRAYPIVLVLLSTSCFGVPVMPLPPLPTNTSVNHVYLLCTRLNSIDVTRLVATTAVAHSLATAPLTHTKMQVVTRGLLSLNFSLFDKPRSKCRCRVVSACLDLRPQRHGVL